MPIIIGVISQKGGVGKSSIVRAIAREFASLDRSVKIADLDVQQGTITKWHMRRLGAGLEPVGSVETYKQINRALKEADHYDLFLLDGPARASKATLEIAQKADLLIQPTGASIDDLEPAILVFHELVKAGIPKKQLTIALSRVQTDAEIEDARSYIEEAGYHVLDGHLLERASYRRAHDSGMVVTEASHPSLRQKASVLIQDIINTVS